MRAVTAVVQTGTRRLELREFQAPDIGPNDGLLRVLESGICGSDWHQYIHGLRPEHAEGVIPGHEPLGIIEEVGDEAAHRWNIKKGDRVAIEAMLPCSACRYCLTGRYNFCSSAKRDERWGAYGYISLARPPMLWGGHAEYMYLAPETILHKLPDHLPTSQAILFNMLGGGVEWTIRCGKATMGETVVILGCGQRGLACVIAARESGAKTIIVTGLERDRGRLELAKLYGAHLTIEVKDGVDVVKKIMQTLDDGADLVIDASSGSTGPVKDAIEIAAPAARVILAGLKSGPVPEFSTEDIMRKGLTIIGPWAVTYESYERAIDILAGGKYDTSLMHTHTLTLDQAEEAYKIVGGELQGEQNIFVSVRS